MFDADWLDVLEEDELLSVYDWCRSRQRELRRRGSYSFAGWYGSGASEVADALGRYYMEIRMPSFSRRQLTLDDMPPRIHPERR